MLTAVCTVAWREKWQTAITIRTTTTKQKKETRNKKERIRNMALKESREVEHLYELLLEGLFAGSFSKEVASHCLIPSIF